MIVFCAVLILVIIFLIMSRHGLVAQKNELELQILSLHDAIDRKIKTIAELKATLHFNNIREYMHHRIHNKDNKE